MVDILHHLIYINMYYCINRIPIVYEVYIRSCRISAIDSMGALAGLASAWAGAGAVPAVVAGKAWMVENYAESHDI